MKKRFLIFLFYINYIKERIILKVLKIKHFILNIIDIL